MIRKVEKIDIGECVKVIRDSFVHTGTKKFDFFPFTCGYMEKWI